MMVKNIFLLLVMSSNSISNSIAMAHDIGRQCNNPYCMMCNRLHLQYGHNTAVSNLSYNQYVNLHSNLHRPQPQPQPQPIFDPTPLTTVDIMLEALKLTKDDVLYDIGCGDGRILIIAVEKYGCKALGIEIDPRIAAIAKQNTAKYPTIKIQVADATTLDLSGATAATMYLPTEVIAKVTPKLTKAKRIVSYSHIIPREGTVKLGPIYLWEVKEFK
jgi:SAM-dependent methyltransferase